MVYEVFGMMLSRENSVNDSYLLPMWVRLIDYMIYLGYHIMIIILGLSGSTKVRGVNNNTLRDRAGM